MVYYCFTHINWGNHELLIQMVEMTARIPGWVSMAFPTA
jgi:hypothetical protein